MTQSKAPQPRLRSRNLADAEGSTRERILNAASRLFAERGFLGSSMPAIAQASGITAGAIYRHFENKAELLLEVVKRALMSLPLTLENNNGHGDTTSLPQAAASYVDPALKLLRQLSLEAHAAASRDADVNRLLIDYDERATAETRKALAACQRAGKMDGRLDPDFAARALTTFIMGLNHMDTLHPHLIGDKRWREFIAERVAVMLGLQFPTRKRRDPGGAQDTESRG